MCMPVYVRVYACECLCVYVRARMCVCVCVCGLCTSSYNLLKCFYSCSKHSMSLVISLPLHYCVSRDNYYSAQHLIEASAHHHFHHCYPHSLIVYTEYHQLLLLVNYKEGEGKQHSNIVLRCTSIVKQACTGQVVLN